jgi:hypothetical protein
MADLSGASLAELQRWFQAAVMSPDTPVAVLADLTPGEVATAITASVRQHPVERLAIYRRGYRLRLLESLRGSFPALCHLLGRDLFDAFADDYLDACPSRSYTLFQLGERLIDHLERTRPDRGRPVAEREEWVDLLIDLARFERVFAEVYHGPGTETGPVLRAADLPADTDPAWAGLTLKPAPCLRVLASRYWVHDYVAAITRGELPPLPCAKPAVLAVHRRAFVVIVTELTPPADRLLAALIDGAAVTAAATAAGIPPGSTHPRIREWADAGLFTACAHSPARGHPPTPSPAARACLAQPRRIGEPDEHPGS